MSKKNNYKVYVHIAPNGKRYYGITKQEVERRWLNGYGYNHNDYFTKAINKYGWDNFEHIVIARGLTEDEAKWLEIELIREWDTINRDKGYNITKGGDGSNPTEETRRKMSESHKGKNNYFYGKTHTEETRKKISESHKGKTLSEETKKKISESEKGKVVSEETKKKIGKSKKGENHPFYGKTLSEETRKKMSESRKGEKHPRATKVYCVELDMVFNTVIEASEYTGCNVTSISSVLTGNRKTAGGYHWLYAEDVNEESINKVLSEEYNKYVGKSKPKQIYCIELDMTFDTITEGAKYVGCDRHTISRVLGRTETAGGYHWIYAKDRDKLAS